MQPNDDAQQMKIKLILMIRERQEIVILVKLVMFSGIIEGLVMMLPSPF